MNRQRKKGWVTGALLAVLLGAVTVLSGCPCPPSKAEGPKRDPGAKLVTINKELGVDVPTVHLSRGKKEAVQWNNTSDETVMILIEDGAVGVEVPAHAFSQVYRVNPRAEIGVHEYTILRPAFNPPNPPQIDVGP